MEVPAGQRNQYLVDVILEKEERETLRKLIQETVREELKSGGMERMPACEKEEIPGQMLDFLFQVLHAFDMDSLVGIVNSFLSNFGVCCV